VRGSLTVDLSGIRTGGAKCKELQEQSEADRGRPEGLSLQHISSCKTHVRTSIRDLASSTLIPWLDSMYVLAFGTQHHPMLLYAAHVRYRVQLVECYVMYCTCTLYMYTYPHLLVCRSGCRRLRGQLLSDGCIVLHCRIAAESRDKHET